MLRRTLLRQDLFRSCAPIAMRVHSRNFDVEVKSLVESPDADPGRGVDFAERERALHEMSSLAGVQESMIDVVRNVQQMTVRPAPELRPPLGSLAAIAAENDGPETWRWAVRRCGPCAIRAGDLVIVDSPSHYESPMVIAEPGHYLCRLTGKVAVELEVEVARCSQVEFETSPVWATYMRKSRYDWLEVPPLFSPVQKVSYAVNAASGATGAEEVRLEVWTRRSSRPEPVIRGAAATLKAVLDARAVPSTAVAPRPAPEATKVSKASGEEAAWQELWAQMPARTDARLAFGDEGAADGMALPAIDRLGRM